MPTKIDRKQTNWIAMGLTPGFGPATFLRWRESKAALPVASGAPALLAHTILADCEGHGIRVVTWEDPDYPAQLRGSRAALPVLYMQGKWGPCRALGMVGTRTPSWSGKAAACALVETLRGLSVSVVSGLAEGIDLTCHRAALDHGLHTMAVLAQGLDQPISGERGRTSQEILRSGGALLSPFPPGTPAYKGNFLARNGIIAGLCEATIVVESREQGGALNTAEHCLADGRKLLAVPGDILRGSAQGPNMLIESQEALAIWLPSQLPILCQLNSPPCPLPHPGTASLAKLSGETCTLGEIMERLGKDPSEILQELSRAELDGYVKQLGDGRYSFGRLFS